MTPSHLSKYLNISCIFHEDTVLTWNARKYFVTNYYVANNLKLKLYFCNWTILNLMTHNVNKTLNLINLVMYKNILRSGLSLMLPSHCCSSLSNRSWIYRKDYWTFFNKKNQDLITYAYLTWLVSAGMSAMM